MNEQETLIQTEINRTTSQRIQELEAQVKRLETANIELLKERAALDAKYLQWTQAIHNRLERLEAEHAI